MKRDIHIIRNIIIPCRLSIGVRLGTRCIIKESGKR